MIARYYHTLRHLKFSQLYWRLYYRYVTVKLDFSEPPATRHGGEWTNPVVKPKKIIRNQEFCFLNQCNVLKSAIDWNNPKLDKLWLYNLHYFDDLNADDASQREKIHVNLINRWIEENPVGHGNGWEPYPISLRIVNWIKWAHAGNRMEEAWLQSLATQIRYLAKKLEWHLLGNHLFANAKALVFSGLYFEGSEADSWLIKGLAIIEKELPEQVLDDGGNFELSTMYHAIFLEDLLDIFNVLRCYGREISSKLTDTIPKMFSWMNAMNHPDGEISFFNDAAFGIAAKPEELAQYAHRLGFLLNKSAVPDLAYFNASGYMRAANHDALVIMDVARIGPDYLPGHAHADTLSFEFSLFKSRVIVNSGISCYGASKERLRQRSTSAHNTVEINGENSSEVWGGFRVARRARPINPKCWRTDSFLHVSGAHDGYRRLPGSPTHQREIVLGEKLLTIIDCVEGPFKTAVSRFYFPPSIQATIDDSGNSGRLILPDGKIIKWCVKGCKGQLVESTYHPEFGKSLKSSCMEFTFFTKQIEVILNWN